MQHQLELIVPLSIGEDIGLGLGRFVADELLADSRLHLHPIPSCASMYPRPGFGPLPCSLFPLPCCPFPCRSGSSCCSVSAASNPFTSTDQPRSPAMIWVRSSGKPK